MSISRKASKITSVVAVLCIAAYIAAIAYGAYRVVVNMGERQSLAESEFSNLADTAVSSSYYLAFLGEEYRQTIRDFLNKSETLSGVIITGTGNEYGFERQQGETIVWTNGSPRFKTGPGLSGNSLFLPLRIDGQRNVTIQAVYSFLDYNLLQNVLKDILLTVLAALGVALLTLLIELFVKKRAAKTAEAFSASDADTSALPYGGPSPIQDSPDGQDDDGPVYDGDRPVSAGTNQVHGSTADVDAVPSLYSPRGNISWEAHTIARLGSELQRASSFGQDLVLITMDWPDTVTIGADDYTRFAGDAAAFFLTRDLVFEKGESGITAIMPGTDLEDGIAKAGTFRRRVASSLPKTFQGRTELRVGLSSRSGRTVNAERLMLEAASALVKAFEEADPCIIAFKTDPDRYREFIKRTGGE